MIPVKVQCGCGQKYAFDIEPVNGRMPGPVACPVCNADGTAAANQIIAQTLASLPPPAPAPVYAPAPSMAPPPTMLRPAASAPPAVAPPPTTTRPTPHDAVRRLAGVGGLEGDNWKWWYYVLAGICIGGFSIWQAYDKQSIKPLGELFFAALLIAIGIWSFNSKRKRAQG